MTNQETKIHRRPAEPIRRLAYTVDEAAAAAGVSAPVVREWMNRADGLPCIKVGRKTIIRVDALDQWLKKLEAVF